MKYHSKNIKAEAEKKVEEILLSKAYPKKKLLGLMEYVEKQGQVYIRNRLYMYFLQGGPDVLQQKINRRIDSSIKKSLIKAYPLCEKMLEKAGVPTASKSFYRRKCLLGGYSLLEKTLKERVPNPRGKKSVLKKFISLFIR